MMNNNQLQLLGRAAAIVEALTDMPHRVLTKISMHPVDMVRPWLGEATIRDSESLQAVMSQIVHIPDSLTVVEQGSWWQGYYSQRDDLSARQSVGGQLRAARLSKGLTLQQVGDKAGLAMTTISKMECGKWSMSVDLIERVCQVLDCTVTINGGL